MQTVCTLSTAEDRMPESACISSLDVKSIDSQICRRYVSSPVPIVINLLFPAVDESRDFELHQAYLTFGGSL